MESLKQFDVCPNPDSASRTRFPFIVLLQHDVLSPLASAVVAPVARPGTEPAIRGLTLEFEHGGEQWLVAVHQLAQIRRSRLPAAVASLADRRDKIMGAIDLIFSGF